ncbi:MAG TPA: DUF5777 family beta-barrel protein, partial [Chitinophagaceae bacterium]|nr:DUF5777 family beta-barrel protein [Chitinophagaceae bacterium]
MKRILLLAALSMLAWGCPAQTDLSKLFPDSSLQKGHQPERATFKSSRLLLSNTNETALKHTLVFYLEHRFDDIAGADGGIKTFYGFDLTQDVNISFDYGITDRLTLGVGRCKGSPEIAFNAAQNGKAVYLNSQSQLWNASLKYRLLEQTTDNHMPFSVTLYGDAVISTMAASTDTFSDAYFQKPADRLSFCGQVILAKKFSDQFSAELLGSVV